MHDKTSVGWIAAVIILVMTTTAAGQQDGAQSEAGPAPTTVVPGREGLLSTFRLLRTSMAPLSDEDQVELAAIPFCEERDEGCRRPPRFVVGDHGVIDLGDVSRRRRVLYMGARVQTERATTVHLFVGLRGELSVWLDGAEVAQGASSRFRRDLVHARLDLPPGEHRLMLRFIRPRRGRWRAALRLLDERFRPGADPATLIVGALDDEAAAELAARAVNFDERHRLGPNGRPEVVVEAHLPGGGVARSIEVELGGEFTLAPSGGVFREVIERRVPMPATGEPLGLEAAAEGRRVRLGARLAEDRRSLEALAALERALEEAPEASRAPLAWRAAELERIVAEGDRDRRWRRLMTTEALRLAEAVASGEDPFAAPTGYQRMAFSSRLDGRAQPYELFVPHRYRTEGTRRWPAVITLHGYKGNAGDYFRNTFGLARDAAGGETLLAHGRHGTVPRRGPMFVIAPAGRGQAMYRHAGEVDVLEALADLRHRFRIDPRRIYITGGSMGGTGAAYIPYRNPDLFAASAALAGYHDQRVRRDTNHDALSPLERFLQAARSDIDWAENALHLHTLLVRGTRDRPLAWTRRLAERLEELSYPYEHREPELGHNVWTETYAEGAIFRYFAPHRRPERPRRVRLRTARERTNHAFWVEVAARSAPDRFADVDAQVGDGGLITVTTEHVRALSLSPEEELTGPGPLRVVIDDQELSGDRPLSLHRTTEGAWEPAPVDYPLPGHKRPGVSGPIRDVYHEPLLFVVGTQSREHLLINRLVARHWARPRGWMVDFPIVDDLDVTEEMIEDHTLVLVGPPSSNLLTRRWADQLPITIEDAAIEVGGRRYEGEQLGTVFVAPNPDAPERALLVIAGTGPLGSWRSLSLPDILPDYVIYDEAIEPVRGHWAAGGTGGGSLEAGLFNMDWSPPGERPESRSPSP